MRSHSHAIKIEPKPIDPVDRPSAREAHYGGLVGELVSEIEERMAYFSQQQTSGPAVPGETDLVHMISMVGGYIGLACGFGIAAILISWAI